MMDLAKRTVKGELRKQHLTVAGDQRHTRDMPTPIPVYVIARPSGYVVHVGELDLAVDNTPGSAFGLAEAIADAIHKYTTQTADVVVVTE
jgi:hypothetical protein